MQSVNYKSQQAPLQELLKTKEEPFEFINGVIYEMKPSPEKNHNRITKRISRILDDYFEDNGLDYESILAPSDVFLREDGNSYVQPDLFVECENCLDEDDGYTHGAPALVMEVISPSTKVKDSTIKRDLYKETGVKEYWILDYKAGLVTVYNFEDHTKQERSFDDIVHSTLFSGLAIDFREIKKRLR